MKNLLIVFVLVIVKSNLLSQSRVWMQDAAERKVKLEFEKGDIDYNNVKGTPYLFPGMKAGLIVTMDIEYIECKLNFDIYLNQIELLFEGKNYLITKPEGFKEFIIDSTRIQYISYIDGNTTKKAFMLVESDSGAYRLFTRKRVIYQKADEAKPYTDPKPERFEQKEDEHYLAFQNNPALQISSLKKLVKALPDLKPIIDEYPEKKVDFDNADELLKLVEFINQKVKL